MCVYGNKYAKNKLPFLWVSFRLSLRVMEHIKTAHACSQCACMHALTRRDAYDDVSSPILTSGFLQVRNEPSQLRGTPQEARGGCANCLVGDVSRPCQCSVLCLAYVQTCVRVFVCLCVHTSCTCICLWFVCLLCRIRNSAGAPAKRV